MGEPKICRPRTRTMQLVHWTLRGRLACSPRQDDGPRTEKKRFQAAQMTMAKAASLAVARSLEHVMQNHPNVPKRKNRKHAEHVRDELARTSASR